MVALLKMPMRIGPETADADSSTNWAERRIFPRKEVHAQVTGVRMDNTVAARRQPWLSLHLRDLSIGGLSAISPAPLERGERLTVNFPENGPLPRWDAYGRVLRCEQSGLGYRIAVEFDPLPAA
jgi:hypothetical protein